MNENDVQNYARDKNNYALLNTDAISYLDYKKQRDQARKFNKIENEVSSLKQDINSIKEMLLTLINGNKNV